MKIVTLHRYKGKPSIKVMVSDRDYARVRVHKWRLNGLGYVCTDIDGRNLYLHRFIRYEPSGMVVDHINRNTLDNRRVNLRVCTVQENIRNAKISKNNTTGYTGVALRLGRTGYRAYIMVDRKQINLGIYASVEEAVSARRNGEKKYFGKFSPNR